MVVRILTLALISNIIVACKAKTQIHGTFQTKPCQSDTREFPNEIQQGPVSFRANSKDPNRICLGYKKYELRHSGKPEFNNSTVILRQTKCGFEIGKLSGGGPEEALRPNSVSLLAMKAAGEAVAAHLGVELDGPPQLRVMEDAEKETLYECFTMRRP